MQVGEISGRRRIDGSAGRVDVCGCQVALGLRDEELKACFTFCNARTKRQADWLLSHIKQTAPQTLLVAE